ncbi:hypothetical protein R1sor_009757 [Riccia sorocarpa]|uniref:Oleosin n=1 Tax=Riccia sorocarpa TaxID=122646 RepID=A0ABD3I044_9MARC
MLCKSPIGNGLLTKAAKVDRLRPRKVWFLDERVVARPTVEIVSTYDLLSTLSRLGRAEEIRAIVMATAESPTKTEEDSSVIRVIRGVKQRTPSSGQLKTVAGWSAAAIAVLVLGGFALVGTSIMLTFVAPLLILFSPVLIPLGIVLVVGTAGTVSVLGFCIAVVSAISWLYNYYEGRDPPGADRIDAARERIICTAREFKEWASHYSSQMRAAPSA